MSDILQLGHPQLRQSAQPIVNFADHHLQAAIDTALTQLIRAGGVGIAAPQVGDPWSWCIVASHPTLRYPDAPYMSPLVMLNPSIVERSEDCERGWEGCLSVPGMRGIVSRSMSVRVIYQTRDGEPRSAMFEGFVARIVQHECDHLYGVVFLDRVECTEDLMSEAEYRRQILKLSADLPI
jgi:peptide deformylase